MSGEFGTGKTIFVLAIVVGCFAVLWPKVFYPMLTASTTQEPTGRQGSSLWQQPSSKEFFAKLCYILEEYNNQGQRWRHDEECLSLVRTACGASLTEAGLQQFRAGVAGNLTECMEREYALTPALVAATAPPSVRHKPYTGPTVARPERPSHLHPEMLHPALREKGRALPQRTIDKQARPGPMPGVRPPMGGGAGHIAPPHQTKGSSSMSVIMPLYTVGIIIFFMYTIMKVLFKKGPEDDDRTPKLKDFHLDPEYRKYVFAEEYLDSGDTAYVRDTHRGHEHGEASGLRRRLQQDHNDTKIEDEQMDQLRRRLEDTERAMERLMSQMGSVSDKLTAAKITEVLSQAQAQAKLLKEVSQPCTSRQEKDCTPQCQSQNQCPESNVVIQPKKEESPSAILKVDQQQLTGVSNSFPSSMPAQKVSFRLPDSYVETPPNVSDLEDQSSDATETGADVSELRSFAEESADNKAANTNVASNEKITKIHSYDDTPVLKMLVYDDTPEAKMPAYDDTPAVKMPAYDDTPEVKMPAYDDTPVLKMPVYDDTPEAKMPAYDDTPVLKMPAYDDTPEVKMSAYDDTPVLKMLVYDNTPEVKMLAYDDTPVVKMLAYDDTPEVKMPTYDDTPVVKMLAYDDTPEVKMPAYDDTPEVKMLAYDDTPEVKMPAYDDTPVVKMPAFDDTPVVKMPVYDDTHVVKLPSYNTPEMKMTSYDTHEVMVPSYETPEVKMPSYDTPEVKTPSYDTPEVKTPSYDTPEVKMLSYDTPEVKMPSYDTPELKMPSYDTPEVKMPSYDTPGMKMPAYDTPEVQKPICDTPKVATPTYDDTAIVKRTVCDTSEVKVSAYISPEAKITAVDTPLVKVAAYDKPQVNTSAIGVTRKVKMAAFGDASELKTAILKGQEEDVVQYENVLEGNHMLQETCRAEQQSVLSEIPPAIQTIKEAAMQPLSNYFPEREIFDTLREVPTTTAGAIQKTDDHFDRSTVFNPLYDHLFDLNLPQSTNIEKVCSENRAEQFKKEYHPSQTFIQMKLEKVLKTPETADEYMQLQDYEENSDSSEDDQVAVGTQTSLAFDPPRMLKKKAAETSTQTDEQTLSVLGMNTSWCTDKNMKAMKIETIPKIRDITLDALLPSETQALVTGAQTDSYFSQNLEMDVSEYESAPYVITSQISLNILGLEQNEDTPNKSSLLLQSAAPTQSVTYANKSEDILKQKSHPQPSFNTISVYRHKDMISMNPNVVTKPAETKMKYTSEALDQSPPPGSIVLMNKTSSSIDEFNDKIFADFVSNSYSDSLNNAQGDEKSNSSTEQQLGGPQSVFTEWENLPETVKWGELFSSDYSSTMPAENQPFSNTSLFSSKFRTDSPPKYTESDIEPWSPVSALAYEDESREPMYFACSVTYTPSSSVPQTPDLELAVPLSYESEVFLVTDAVVEDDATLHISASSPATPPAEDTRVPSPQLSDACSAPSKDSSPDMEDYEVVQKASDTDCALELKQMQQTKSLSGGQSVGSGASDNTPSQLRPASPTRQDNGNEDPDKNIEDLGHQRRPENAHEEFNHQIISDNKE